MRQIAQESRFRGADWQNTALPKSRAQEALIGTLLSYLGNWHACGQCEWDQPHMTNAGLQMWKTQSQWTFFQAHF